jgi:hypothetical protein
VHTAFATAAAVATMPISPTPLVPIGLTWVSCSSIHETSMVPMSA